MHARLLDVYEPFSLFVFTCCVEAHNINMNMIVHKYIYAQAEVGRSLFLHCLHTYLQLCLTQWEVFLLRNEHLQWAFAMSFLFSFRLM